MLTLRIEATIDNKEPIAVSTDVINIESIEIQSQILIKELIRQLNKTEFK